MPIGLSDFKKVIDEDFYYVDKSLFIKDIIEDSSNSILLPRPRRFGKTLNLSMLRYFFETTETDTSYLFKHLKIWQEDEKYRNMQGQYPVIFITFKDVKLTNWENCFEQIKIVISEEFKRHKYLLETDFMDDAEKKIFNRIVNLEGNPSDYENSLKYLIKYLYNYNLKQVIVLIDEYDTPIHSAYLNNYYNQIIGFIRTFLSGGLKDNEYLKKGVLTGILRIAKESIFSGLNNLSVYSILSSKYSDKFGFLENETIDMLQYYDVEYKINEVKQWYNGYIFGENLIYNPWSIIKFIDNVDYGLSPHWVNTSSNDLIKKLITNGGEDIKKDLETLITGTEIEKELNVK